MQRSDWQAIAMIRLEGLPAWYFCIKKGAPTGVPFCFGGRHEK
jgi:hypothetical protein